MSEQNGNAPDQQIKVDDRLVLQQVRAQRDRALDDLAVTQAACQQLAAQVRELQAQQNGQPSQPEKTTAGDAT